MTSLNTKTPGYKDGGWKKKYVIKKICKKCEGTGAIKKRHPVTNYINKFRCPDCDGSGTISVDPGITYFVLNLHKDPHARVAMLAYAESVKSDNPVFYQDILKVLEDTKEKA